MVERLPHAVARTTTGFRVFDGAFVDFAAESGSADVRRYRVVEATPSQVNGTNFARLDAAVLRIEPLPDGPQDVPDALTVSADPDGPLGRLASYCIVGYPAQPVYESGTIEGVDWAWVTRTLFGNVYGVKRLAPGMTHRPLGSLPRDKRRWVFGHDATTLGGYSGSPALAWTDSAFGLHFAGRSIDTNYAHAISAITTELRPSASRSAGSDDPRQTPVGVRPRRDHARRQLRLLRWPGATARSACTSPAGPWTRTARTPSRPSPPSSAPSASRSAGSDDPPPSFATSPRGRLVTSVLDVKSASGGRVADRRRPGPRDSPTGKRVPADRRLRAAVGL